jgi:hypothetical protein
MIDRPQDDCRAWEHVLLMLIIGITLLVIAAAGYIAGAAPN